MELTPEAVTRVMPITKRLTRIYAPYNADGGKMGEAIKRLPVNHQIVRDRRMCPFGQSNGYGSGCRLCESGRREKYSYGAPERVVYDVSQCFTETRYSRLLEKSGLRGDQLKHTLDNYKVDRLNERVYKAIKDWDYRCGRGLYIAPVMPQRSANGDTIYPEAYNKRNPQGNGTGKTYALEALTHRLCREGVGCLFSTSENFIQELRSTFDEYARENEGYVLDKYIHVPVLLWDDLGKESFNRNNDWAPAKINHVINERTSRRKPIVISSNFYPEELLVRFGEDNHGASIESRIVGSCDFYRLGGGDRRRV